MTEDTIFRDPKYRIGPIYFKGILREVLSCKKAGHQTKKGGKSDEKL
jgi:hypothetical protein